MLVVYIMAACTCQAAKPSRPSNPTLKVTGGLTRYPAHILTR